MSTATGNPAQFTVTNGVLTSMSIPFTPTQDTSSYPSPTNIKPINGVSNITIYQTGKNMLQSTPISLVDEYFPPDVTVVASTEGGSEYGKPQIVFCDSEGTQVGYRTLDLGEGTRTYRSFNTYANSYKYRLNRSPSKAQMELGTTPSDYEEPNYHTYEVTFPVLGKNLLDITNVVSNKVINSDGTISDNNDFSYTGLIRVKAGEKYTVSMDYTLSFTSTRRIHGYNINGEWVQQIDYFSTPSAQRYTKTITIPSGIDFVRINIRKYDENWMLEAGETATAYEPYTTTCYGGTFDAVSGVLTLTHGWTHLSSLTWIDSGHTNIFRGQGLTNTPTENTYDIMCSSYSVSNIGYSYMTDKMISSRASFNYHEVMLKDTDYSSASDLAASFDDDDVLVYELATPITVQCTGANISLLSGTNTIWTDTNGTNTIVYTEGSQLYIAKVQYKANSSATPVVWMDVTDKTVTTGNLLYGETALRNDGVSITGNYDPMASLAIIANGNTHAALTSGQFVYIRDHDTLSDGLYLATADVALDGTLSSLNVAAVNSGALNSIIANADLWGWRNVQASVVPESEE